MTRDELTALIEKHPKLSYWAEYADKGMAIDSLLIFTPDMAENIHPAYTRYRHFCKNLSIEPPYLVVLNDHEADQKYRELSEEERVPNGIYFPSLNTVYLSAESYQLFEIGNVLGDFVTGHELAHAKSYHPNRRRVMSYLVGTAAAASVLVSGKTLSHAVFHHETTNTDTPPPPAWLHIPIPFAMAILAGRHVTKITDSVIERHHEFVADDLVDQASGQPGTRIAALIAREVLNSDETLMKAIPAIVRAYKTTDTYQQELAELKRYAPELEQHAEAIVLANQIFAETKTMLPLSQILNADLYPSNNERYHHAQREVQKRVRKAKSEEGRRQA